MVCDLGWWLVEVSRLGGHPLRSLRSASPYASRRGRVSLDTCLRGYDVVYEPPASRFACRVPLLFVFHFLGKKGRKV